MHETSVVAAVIIVVADAPGQQEEEQQLVQVSLFSCCVYVYFLCPLCRVC